MQDIVDKLKREKESLAKEIAGIRKEKGGMFTSESAHELAQRSRLDPLVARLSQLDDQIEFTKKERDYAKIGRPERHFQSADERRFYGESLKGIETPARARAARELIDLTGPDKLKSYEDMSLEQIGKEIAQVKRGLVAGRSPKKGRDPDAPQYDRPSVPTVPTTKVSHGTPSGLLGDYANESMSHLSRTTDPNVPFHNKKLEFASEEDTGDKPGKTPLRLRGGLGDASAPAGSPRHEQKEEEEHMPDEFRGLSVAELADDHRWVRYRIRLIDRGIVEEGRDSLWYNRRRDLNERLGMLGVEAAPEPPQGLAVGGQDAGGEGPVAFGGEGPKVEDEMKAVLKQRRGDPGLVHERERRPDPARPRDRPRARSLQELSDRLAQMQRQHQQQRAPSRPQVITQPAAAGPVIVMGGTPGVAQKQKPGIKITQTVRQQQQQDLRRRKKRVKKGTKDVLAKKRKEYNALKNAVKKAITKSKNSHYAAENAKIKNLPSSNRKAARAKLKASLKKRKTDLLAQLPAAGKLKLSDLQALIVKARKLKW